MEAIYLDSGSGANAAPAAVNVRPAVLFSVLEQHLRREKGQDRVIGASPGGAAAVRRRRCSGGGAARRVAVGRGRVGGGRRLVHGG